MPLRTLAAKGWGGWSEHASLRSPLTREVWAKRRYRPCPPRLGRTTVGVGLGVSGGRWASVGVVVLRLHAGIPGDYLSRAGRL